MMHSALRRVPFAAASSRFASAAAPAAVQHGVRSKHTLPDLPYDYNALEPYISAEIMQLHHQKHHQTYVSNLNVAEEKLEEAVQKKDTATVLSLNSALNFNYGGHVNHSIFWKNLAPQKEGGGDLTKGVLQTAIHKEFGSLDDFIKTFNASTVAVQGSGWGWLVYNKNSKKLEIVTTSNQNPVTGPHVPLLGIDVWEHAYYLQYKNVRPDYLKAVWNVVNWKDVSSRFVQVSHNFDTLNTSQNTIMSSTLVMQCAALSVVLAQLGVQPWWSAPASTSSSVLSTTSAAWPAATPASSALLDAAEEMSEVAQCCTLMIAPPEALGMPVIHGVRRDDAAGFSPDGPFSPKFHLGSVTVTKSSVQKDGIIVRCRQDLVGATTITGFGIVKNEHLNCSATTFPNVTGLPDLQILTIQNCSMPNVTVPWSDFASNNPGLETIILTSSELTGTIGESVANLTVLTELQLSGNNFTGPLPSSIFEISTLKALNVSRNEKLSGGVPFGLTQNAHLTTLDLSDTSIAGPLPELPQNFTGCTLPTGVCAAHNRTYSSSCGTIPACSGLANVIADMESNVTPVPPASDATIATVTAIASPNSNPQPAVDHSAAFVPASPPIVDSTRLINATDAEADDSDDRMAAMGLKTVLGAFAVGLSILATGLIALRSPWIRKTLGLPKRTPEAAAAASGNNGGPGGAGGAIRGIGKMDDDVQLKVIKLQSLKELRESFDLDGEGDETVAAAAEDDEVVAAPIAAHERRTEVGGAAVTVRRVFGQQEGAVGDVENPFGDWNGITPAADGYREHFDGDIV